MRPGAVIVDLAVEAGGNCPLSKFDQIVTTKNGVKIIGYGNVAGRLAEDASALFAKNLLNFITPLVDAETKEFAIDWEDEIVQGTLVTRGGKVVHPMLTAKKPAKKADKAKKPASKPKRKGK
jgi:NAD(P) transhydrogenase subunit alpha